MRTSKNKIELFHAIESVSLYEKVIYDLAEFLTGSGATISEIAELCDKPERFRTVYYWYDVVNSIPRTAP